MINGVNHITFAVSELERSIYFYTEILGLELMATWPKGAYLLAGQTWIALNLNTAEICINADDSHIAFNVDETNYESLKERLLNNEVRPYRENKSDGKSYYFLDPDGHKLEIHSNTLYDRMKWAKEIGWAGFEIEKK